MLNDSNKKMMHHQNKKISHLLPLRVTFGEADTFFTLIHILHISDSTDMEPLRGSPLSSLISYLLYFSITFTL